MREDELLVLGGPLYESLDEIVILEELLAGHRRLEGDTLEELDLEFVHLLDRDPSKGRIPAIRVELVVLRLPRDDDRDGE